MLRTCTFIVLLAVAHTVHAQWAVTSEAGAGSKQRRAVASIRNTEGYTLQLFRDDRDNVRLRFVLKSGFDTIGGCPTFQVDEKPPEHASADGSPCDTLGKSAEFVLGHVQGHSLKSLSLHRLLNGDKVTFRFTLKEHGYGETGFTLSRSKQAVRGAIGTAVKIAPN